MRVLFVASPLVGHVHPLVPLATALGDAGHRVVLATAADGVRAGRSGDLDVRDVAPGFDLRTTFLRPALRHPVLGVRETRGRAGTALVGHLFAAVAEKMADGVVELADQEHPDLVVHEPLAAAGSLAAARLGVPVVTVDASLYDARELLAATTAHLGSTAQRFGVERFAEPAETLVTAPRSVIRSDRGRLMRYVAVSGDRPAPEELTRRGGRPRIIVTRSTVEDPRPDALMSTVVAAAAGAALDVVVVRPDRTVRERALPPNVTTTDWLPFAAVFPAASGVVHHGGAGTLLTALAAGVPQLIAPGPGDRRTHAGLVADRGAGLAVPAKRITADDLERLVGDPALASAAGEVAAEIAAMPSPADLVPDLVELAATRR